MEMMDSQAAAHQGKIARPSIQLVSTALRPNPVAPIARHFAGMFCNNESHITVLVVTN